MNCSQWDYSTGPIFVQYLYTSFMFSLCKLSITLWTFSQSLLLQQLTTTLSWSFNKWHASIFFQLHCISVSKIIHILLFQILHSRVNRVDQPLPSFPSYSTKHFSSSVSLSLDSSLENFCYCQIGVQLFNFYIDGSKFLN